MHAYLVKTAFQPDFELDDARTVAAALEVPLTVVEADVLAQADICANPADRCYLCKRFIFDEVRRTAAADGFTVIVDGTNATDDPERRPGFKALAEAGVVSPLRRAGMTKANVRHVLASLEERFGLAPGALMSAKPSFPCLAVYVPQGESITEASLREAARIARTVSRPALLNLRARWGAGRAGRRGFCYHGAVDLTNRGVPGATARPLPEKERDS